MDSRISVQVCGKLKGHENRMQGGMRGDGRKIVRAMPLEG